MGLDFWTVISCENSGRPAPAEVHAMIARVESVAVQWFEIGGHRASKAGGGSRRIPNPTWDAKVAPPWDPNRPKWDATRVKVRLELLEDRLADGSLTVPADGDGPLDLGDGADPTVPSHMGSLIHASIEWSNSFSNGTSFKSSVAAAVYPPFVNAIINQLNPVRVVDGIEILKFRDEERARLVYYRDPTSFVRSFLLFGGLRGDPSAIVAVLRELAEADTLTSMHYSGPHDAGSPYRAPSISESNPGGPGRVRRLRFTPDGGVVLERGRFAVGDPDYYIGSQANPQQLLEQALLERGVVWRV